MDNVFEYLKWRDDLVFENLNEIDALIFNRLSYLPLEKIMNSGDKLLISEVYKKINDSNLECKYDDRKLLKSLANCYRYKDLCIGNLSYKFDVSLEEQFMAITIYLPNNCVYISYRGTTEEIVAWKEDFNMSFMVVPAQIDAVNYLNSVKSKKIYLGGHSKGGNLAMYAGINADNKIRSRIIKVYNFDGPGFLNLDDKYFSFKNKIISYLPSDCIVGRLLNLDNDFVIVKSRSRGIGQHNLYNWQILKDKFIISDNFSRDSDNIKNIISEFLDKVSLEERKSFINNVYDVLNSSGNMKISDINLSYVKDIIYSYHNMDEKKKKLLYTIISYLIGSAKDNIKF